MKTDDAEQGHLVLVVEDDPETAAFVADIIRSRGDRPVVATTVAQAIALLAEIDPCYILADQELPAHDGATPLIGGGERIVEHARDQDPRRVDEKWHVRPIVVVTGWASDHEFVSKMYELGASAFQPKPFGRDGVGSLLGKIRTCLERARRLDHAACAALARPAAKPAAATGPRVVIDGTNEKARMVVLIDGHRRTMQESAFVSLLRAIAAHERSPGAWSSRESLLIGPSRNATTRIREPFRDLVPDGFDVLESDRMGRFRLNPSVVVERVDWAALAESPNVQMKKIAKEQRDRSR